MKHFLIEPTYKKSLIEKTLYRRNDEEGNIIFLEKELGWRWGSFMISVPENKEEVLEFIKDEGYAGDDAILNWASNYGYAIWDGEEYLLDPDMTLLEMIREQMLPNELDDFVDITEDYAHAQMLDFSDSCWGYWSVHSQAKLTEEEQDAFIQEAEAAEDDEYEAGVENLGWEYVDTYFELQCSPKITECDEMGSVFVKEADLQQSKYVL